MTRACECRTIHSSARSIEKRAAGHLRSKRRMRRSRYASPSGQSRGQIVDAISIRERPAEAEDRAIPGHWEGDLLSGAKNSYIATLVERPSRFAMLIKVPSSCCGWLEPACSQTPGYSATLLDVGSRIGDGQTPGLYGSHRCASLFLRSPKSLGAWDERKH